MQVKMTRRELRELKLRLALKRERESWKAYCAKRDAEREERIRTAKAGKAQVDARVYRPQGAEREYIGCPPSARHYSHATVAAEAVPVRVTPAHTNSKGEFVPERRTQMSRVCSPRVRMEWHAKTPGWTSWGNNSRAISADREMLRTERAIAKQDDARRYREGLDKLYQ